MMLLLLGASAIVIRALCSIRDLNPGRVDGLYFVYPAQKGVYNYLGYHQATEEIFWLPGPDERERKVLASFATRPI